jgi:zinc transporter, ZIP family
MSLRPWSLLVVTAFVVALAGRFVAMRATHGESRGGEVTVDHATLLPGEIVLTLERHAGGVVAIAHTIVNDSYVNFEAGTPGTADVAIDYPWIEGESYEIELLTATGVSIDYEIEEAGAA